MSTERTVVVTGAAGGMGSAIAEGFLGDGARVVATGRAGEHLDRYRQRMAGRDRIEIVAADLTREADCTAVAEAAGEVDVLVNFAGAYPTRSFDDLTADEFRSTLEVNLVSAFMMVKAVHPRMRSRSAGRIVNVTTAAIYEGVANQIDYVAAKAGVVGLTRSLARALGPDGITVNAVAPGIVETPRVTASFPKDLLDQQVSLRSIARAEHPDDVVGAVVFLASEGAAMISGQTLVIDGGKSML